MKPSSPDAGGRVPCKIRRITGKESSVKEDWLAAEEPLEIQLGYERKGTRVHKSISVTMRTPGHDEELAIGFLFTEQILRDLSQVAKISLPAENIIRVELKAGILPDLLRLERNFYTSSSCGVCGKSSIEAIRADLSNTADGGLPPIDSGVVHRLPETLRGSQELFDSTGGLHAAGLFDREGGMEERREDVGRHNAVDKVIGARLLAGKSPPFYDRILMVSGRASFELMQKALAAGIPVLAAVGAPSSLAVKLAQRHGATLLGFVRDGRYNIYYGEERLGTSRESPAFAGPDRSRP